MKNTIQETVKEVYKINNNNNVKFNKNIYDFEREFPRPVPRNNTNTNVTSPSLSSPTSFSINPFLIVLLLLIVLSIAIIAFQEKIKDFFMKYFKDGTLEKEKKNLESKVTEEKVKTQALQQELKELKELKKKKEENKSEPSKTSNNDKIKQSYSKTQMVNEDGYCYIGTDDNMRHCVNAYVGDVCTSSDVYKSMDDCLMPKSSSNEACYL
tara:strand:- start:196 stop:825 length:630 start_codon:yes stop_codon:yes gene_type:complete